MAMPKDRSAAIKKVRGRFNQAKTHSVEEYDALKRWIKLSITTEQIAAAFSSSWGVSKELKEMAFRKWERMTLAELNKANSSQKITEVRRKGPYGSKKVNDLTALKLSKLKVKNFFE